MKLKKTLVALIITLGGGVAACQPVEPSAPRIHVDNGYMNVRNMGDDYVHYEIMDGEHMITCREHVKRSELACWPTVETYADEEF